jgi:hypothetical protein
MPRRPSSSGGSPSLEHVSADTCWLSTRLRLLRGRDGHVSACLCLLCFGHHHAADRAVEPDVASDRRMDDLAVPEELCGSVSFDGGATSTVIEASSRRSGRPGFSKPQVTQNGIPPAGQQRLPVVSGASGRGDERSQDRTVARSLKPKMDHRLDSSGPRAQQLMVRSGQSNSSCTRSSHPHRVHVGHNAHPKSFPSRRPKADNRHTPGTHIQSVRRPPCHSRRLSSSLPACS